MRVLDWYRGRRSCPLLPVWVGLGPQSNVFQWGSRFLALCGVLSTIYQATSTPGNTTDDLHPLLSVCDVVPRVFNCQSSAVLWFSSSWFSSLFNPFFLALFLYSLIFCSPSASKIYQSYHNNVCFSGKAWCNFIQRVIISYFPSKRILEFSTHTFQRDHSLPMSISRFRWSRVILVLL